MLRSFIRIIKSFNTKLTDDHVSAYSAQAAFFIILSFFPFLMFLLALLQYLPFSQEALLEFVSRFIPAQINVYVLELINELYNKSSNALISITVIIAIWTASKGVYSITQGLNSVYHIQETRGYIVLRIRATIYTIILAVLLILMLAFFVFGNQLALWISTYIPSINDYALFVISGRTVVGLLVFIAFFLILYSFVPNRQSTLLKELPGAIIASAGWIGFSFLYSFYIDNMSNMSSTYGSLTAIVLCMLWLYICMSIMFFGAEINSVLANPAVLSAIRRFFKREKT